MPGITLKISGEPNAELVRRVVPAITALTCEVLEKRPDQTVVVLDFVPHAHWFIHGRSLVEHGLNAFRLEVTVTDETNTKTQKARFHREAYGLLAELIGDLHAHSNVHVIDCRAGAYGYGGVTQEYRYQRG
ncbi:MAG: hypothetical protein GAK37_00620 [Pseudomonas sp.]|nr:MAG: hypothetical protein GAK37_00620 [Pseudomonas sp.]